MRCSIAFWRSHDAGNPTKAFAIPARRCHRHPWGRPSKRFHPMETPEKPDFSKGIPVARLPDDGLLAGQIDGEDAMLVRRGGTVFAVGSSCTHYHGPLAEGIVIGEDVRCPLHHACFNLRSGEALHAPAFD